MSIESAKAFVAKVKNDEEFAKKIAGAASRQERGEIARAEGFDFTPAELKSVTSELSLEELDTVAGGSWGCGSTHEAEGDDSCPTPGEL